MEISDQLVKPLVDKILNEYCDLYHALSTNPSEGAREIRSTIERKLGELGNVSTRGVGVWTPSGRMNPEDVRENLRQLKLEMRFLRRRWQRQQTSENRVRRNREKRASYVSTVAA